MKEIVFATNNKHKLEEIKPLLASYFKVISLSELGVFEDIPETGTTLVENAFQKARFIFNRYNIDCFADDTGLEIEALNNRPGVYSARYAGEKASFDDNVNKVLDELKNIENRKACFKTVIALILDGKEYFFEGNIEGIITTEKHGQDGFGYDPIFKPLGSDLTFAEIPLNEKNKISHRAIATKKLINFFENI